MSEPFYIDLEYRSPDRFDAGALIEYNVDNYDILTSDFVDKIPSLDKLGNLDLKNQEGRPDLVSWDLYQDTSLWWIIMLYAAKTTAEEFEIGDTIDYPSMTQLEQSYFNIQVEARTT